MEHFWTTYALCTRHAGGAYAAIPNDAEIKIHFDDDVWVATHFESNTEWTLSERDVDTLRQATLDACLAQAS